MHRSESAKVASPALAAPTASNSEELFEKKEAGAYRQNAQRALTPQDARDEKALADADRAQVGADAEKSGALKSKMDALAKNRAEDGESLKKVKEGTPAKDLAFATAPEGGKADERKREVLMLREAEQRRDGGEVLERSANASKADKAATGSAAPGKKEKSGQELADARPAPKPAAPFNAPPAATAPAPVATPAAPPPPAPTAAPVVIADPKAPAPGEFVANGTDTNRRMTEAARKKSEARNEAGEKDGKWANATESQKAADAPKAAAEAPKPESKGQAQQGGRSQGPGGLNAGEVTKARKSEEVTISGLPAPKQEPVAEKQAARPFATAPTAEDDGRTAIPPAEARAKELAKNADSKKEEPPQTLPLPENKPAAKPAQPTTLAAGAAPAVPLADKPGLGVPADGTVLRFKSANQATLLEKLDALIASEGGVYAVDEQRKRLDQNGAGFGGGGTGTSAENNFIRGSRTPKLQQEKTKAAEEQVNALEANTLESKVEAKKDAPATAAAPAERAAATTPVAPQRITFRVPARNKAQVLEKLNALKLEHAGVKFNGLADNAKDEGLAKEADKLETNKLDDVINEWVMITVILEPLR
jgi:hypothetical protein